MFKEKKFWIAGIAAIVAVGGLVIFQHYFGPPRGLSSQAGCYGYGCASYVTIGARVPGKAYGFEAPFTYGTLKVPLGSPVEVTWYGVNVINCKADGKWTNQTGSYLPPTLYTKSLTKTVDIGVICTTDNGPIYASVTVIPGGKTLPRGQK
jgi:hypothetical protein